VLGHVRGAAAAARQAVVSSCHQPAAALWTMFDTVRAGPGPAGVSRSPLTGWPMAGVLRLWLCQLQCGAELTCPSPRAPPPPPTPARQVTLLSAGRLLFNGPAGELAAWLGGAFGVRYDPALHGLPPDFALSLVSLAFGGQHPGSSGVRSADGGGLAGGGGAPTGGGVPAVHIAAAAVLFRQRQQQWQLEAARAAGGPDAGLADRAGGGGGWLCVPRRGRAAPRRAGFASQAATLLRRELLLVARDPADAAGRTLTFIWVAALVGACFYSMPDAASGLRSRLNILFSSLCFLLLMP
jgi:ATP-binding cassette subfamily G (WHITE) protein 2